MSVEKVFDFVLLGQGNYGRQDVLPSPEKGHQVTSNYLLKGSKLVFRAEAAGYKMLCFS